MQQEPYDPLDYENLADSVLRALLKQSLAPFPPEEERPAAGVYAIYYASGFQLYRPLVIDLRDPDPTSQHPIYVGCAMPSKQHAGRELYARLQEHAKSIAQVRNLDPAHFHCRPLVVEDVWIRLAERTLIEHFKPVWNDVLKGFGIHDPGGGRRAGKLSLWDTLHPGRRWAPKQPRGSPMKHVRNLVTKHLRERFGTLSPHCPYERGGFR